MANGPTSEAINQASLALPEFAVVLVIYYFPLPHNAR
jgi:hypothetical protein